MTRRVDPWDAHAAWWQQQFTEGSDPEYVEQIVPLVVEHLAGCARVLDVGTGEGQVARALVETHGSAVTGVDPSWEQVRVAGRRAGGPTYARASAAALPFAEQSFDGAVCCLVLEHVEQVDPAFSEISRVLGDRGAFLLVLNHPIFQAPGSGWIDDRILDEQYWRVGSYTQPQASVEQVEHGVFIRFYHRPLSAYVNAMAAAGLLIQHMEEPAPPEGFRALAPEYEQAATIPRMCVLLARRMPGMVGPK